jgi:hypothetical protein
MKTKLILSAAIIGCSLLSQAQFINPTRLKTANDGMGGLITPLNTAVDLAWEASVTSINSGYTKARRVFTAGWISTPFADADWISYPHGCGTNQSESWCPSGANVDEFFRVTFDLGGSGTYVLNYTAYADNCIYKMYINNTTTPFYTTSNPTPYTASGFLNPALSGSIPSGLLLPGTNTLYVHVKSGNAQSSGNTGLLFNGVGTYSWCPCDRGIPNGLVANQQQQIDELKALFQAQTESNKVATTSQPVTLSDKNIIVLNQNVPNPFAESTVISYNIPTDFTKAQVQFYTGDGRIINTVDITEKGAHNLTVFANDLSHGIYTYKLVVDGKTIDTKKMIKD